MSESQESGDLALRRWSRIPAYTTIILYISMVSFAGLSVQPRQAFLAAPKGVW